MLTRIEAPLGHSLTSSEAAPEFEVGGSERVKEAAEATSDTTPPPSPDLGAGRLSSKVVIKLDCGGATTTASISREATHPPSYPLRVAGRRPSPPGIPGPPQTTDDRPHSRGISGNDKADYSPSG